MKIIKLTLDKATSQILSRSMHDFVSNTNEGAKKIEKLLETRGFEKSGYNEEHGYWWASFNNEECTYRFLLTT
tara:strand:- start:548 stop:766 length:219 start_codon:yes stop_codon:yes gene_type:complete